jgi:release factor glutamine methyltransferase
MMPSWTLLPLLREATEYLAHKGISSPRLDTEVLMAHVLGCRRIDLYLRHDQPIAAVELDRFRESIRRRSQREPVAYITGNKEFWSLVLEVSSHVLIPRPETELLVEVTLGALRGFAGEGRAPLRLWEIGTGSGAVAIALARESGEEVRILATDRSREALSLARANARALGVEDRVTFRPGDLFQAAEPGDARFCAIVSNPPYVVSSQIQHLEPEIRDHEPREALDGGPDGLAVIRAILQGAPDWLEPWGGVLLEVGADQRGPVEGILGESNAWRNWEWHRDLSGKDRVLRAIRS